MSDRCSTLHAFATVWFDGGTGLGAATVEKMVALRQRLQPQAVTFGGCAAMPVNSVAWVGTESGHAPYPLWCEKRIFCAIFTKTDRWYQDRLGTK